MNKKILIIVLAIIIILALAADVYFIFYPSKNVMVENIRATSPKEATYMIEGHPVTLVNGVSSVPAAPGSASMVVTRYFGNELKTDLDGDGRPDVAFILTQEQGGSGVFFYAVAALNTENGYVGSDGYFLGDRIAPQTTNLSPNQRQKFVVVFNYADRLSGEPMTTQPSVGKSAYLKLDPKTMQWGIVEPIFPGESNLHSNLSCNDSPNYFIISKSLTDSVGSDILVKSKTSQSQIIPCVYTVGQNDFEIKNAMAEYFLAATGHFLILDSGTAPYPRGLIVYDLNTREKIYTDKYSQPISVSGSSVTYWSPTSIKPTALNCPKLAEYSAGGLGAEVEHFVTLDLPSATKTDSGQSRCSATQ